MAAHQQCVSVFGSACAEHMAIPDCMQCTLNAVQRASSPVKCLVAERKSFCSGLDMSCRAKLEISCGVYYQGGARCYKCASAMLSHCATESRRFCRPKTKARIRTPMRRIVSRNCTSTFVQRIRLGCHQAAVRTNQGCRNCIDMLAREHSEGPCRIGHLPSSYMSHVCSIAVSYRTNAPKFSPPRLHAPAAPELPPIPHSYPPVRPVEHSDQGVCISNLDAICGELTHSHCEQCCARNSRMLGEFGCAGTTIRRFCSAEVQDQRDNSNGDVDVQDARVEACEANFRAFCGAFEGKAGCEHCVARHWPVLGYYGDLALQKIHPFCHPHAHPPGYPPLTRHPAFSNPRLPLPQDDDAADIVPDDDRRRRAPHDGHETWFEQAAVGATSKKEGECDDLMRSMCGDQSHNRCNECADEYWHVFKEHGCEEAQAEKFCARDAVRCIVLPPHASAGLVLLLMSFSIYAIYFYIFALQRTGVIEAAAVTTEANIETEGV